MTPVTTLTLAEFLLARIAEDEVVARAAGEPDMVEERKPSGKPTGRLVPTGETLHAYAAGLARDEDAPEDAVELIERFGPARVLAECEAKRKLIELHKWTTTTQIHAWVKDWIVCTTCHAVLDAPDGWPEDKDWHYPLIQQPWPCPTLRALAQPYADHPDFRDGWR